MTLYELSQVMRSKNAGPFTVTIDIFFESAADLDRAIRALSPDRVASLYACDAEQVSVRPCEQILAVKVSLPRPGASSGAPGDRDVYGCQQHFPLADLDV